MVAFTLDQIKDFMSQLLLTDTFDSFSFIEGEIITFNTFRIDGLIQKDFFDTGTDLPEYSPWKSVRDYCFSIIRGKRTPLGFRFVFRLSAKNTARFVQQHVPSMRPEEITGLYLNIHYDGNRLSCVTGTSMRTFTMDKTAEHAWDETVERFFREKGISCEKQ